MADRAVIAVYLCTRRQVRLHPSNLACHKEIFIYFAATYKPPSSI